MSYTRAFRIITQQAGIYQFLTKTGLMIINTIS